MSTLTADYLAGFNTAKERAVEAAQSEVTKAQIEMEAAERQDNPVAYANAKVRHDMVKRLVGVLRKIEP